LLYPRPRHPPDLHSFPTRRSSDLLQMDIKIDGLSREILEEALTQAKIGRLHILESMIATINTPRTTLSKFAPKIIMVKINPDKIDRKSTRLNSSHVKISYAVFCLK